MPAPRPELILSSPPPLNPLAAVWPYLLIAFPAKRLLTGYLGAPKVAVPQAGK